MHFQGLYFDWLTMRSSTNIGKERRSGRSTKRQALFSSPERRSSKRKQLVQSIRAAERDGVPPLWPWSFYLPTLVFIHPKAIGPKFESDSSLNYQLLLQELLRLMTLRRMDFLLLSRLPMQICPRLFTFGSLLPDVVAFGMNWYVAARGKSLTFASEKGRKT